MFNVIFDLEPGCTSCAPEPNLLNLNLGVQVWVRQLAAPNLNVQVQVHVKQPEPEPNRTVTSLLTSELGESAKRFPTRAAIQTNKKGGKANCETHIVGV